MDQSTEGRLVRLETKQETILVRLTKQNEKLDSILILLAYVRGAAWVLFATGGFLGTAAAWFTHIKKFFLG